MLCNSSWILRIFRPQQLDISGLALSLLANEKGFNSMFCNLFSKERFVWLGSFAISYVCEPLKRLRPEGNMTQMQGRAQYHGTCLTSTANIPGIQDTKNIVSLAISSAYNRSFRYGRSKTGEEIVANVNDDLVRIFQVYGKRRAKLLKHPHILAALSVVFIFVQLLLHTCRYRYIKERPANDTIVYRYSLTRKKRQVSQPGRTKYVSLSQKRTVKKINFFQYLFLWALLTIGLVCHQFSLACTDIRGQLSGFNCLDYDADISTFSMTCSFAWTSTGIGTSKCIVLQKNEKFEGNGHSIDLNGINNWEGLFRIATSNENSPSSLDDAPMIHDARMIGGETSGKGGFIIQAEQKHCVVKNCSSSGVIRGSAIAPGFGGGGICGHGCSGDILITHCWSTGEIRYTAGGIAGKELGIDGNTDNTVTISHCYSTGDLVGLHSGGICGHRGGHNNKGILTIQQCYSLGEIGG